MGAIYDVFKIGRELIGMVKDAKELLPDSPDKERIIKRIEDAERSLRIAEAEAARNLGYEICRCTFPPQVMLSKGGDSDTENFECPKCRRREKVGGTIQSEGPNYFEPMG